MRPSRRAVVLGTSALSVLAACGGGGDGTTAPTPAPPTTTPPVTTPTTPTAPSGPPLGVRLPVDTARPGTILRVVLGGGSAPATADATVGGVPFPLARQDDSTLVGLIPEVAAGAQPVRLTVGGRAGEATLSVRVGLSVPDPAALLTAQLDSTAARFAGSHPVGWASADWEAARAATDRAVRDARQRLGAAPAAERLAAGL
ncbi:hypothetical protein PYV61_23875, partial [Roseisolibacter sp. H3M3-2]